MRPDAQKQTVVFVQIHSNQFVLAHVRLQPTCDVKLFTVTFRLRVHLMTTINYNLKVLQPQTLGWGTLTENDQSKDQRTPHRVPASGLHSSLLFMKEKGQLNNVVVNISTTYY